MADSLKNVLEVSDIAYGIISNITREYHARDLRNYFSQFVEADKFICFHYRHRPEIRKLKTCDKSHLTDLQQSRKCCCIIKLASGNLRHLIQLYHRKHWLDRNGDMIRERCFVARLKISEGDGENNVGNMSYKTRAEQSAIDPKREAFTLSDLDKLAEFHPPSVMPQGNVGTPTRYFLGLIKECKMPSGLIRQLDLHFPKSRSSKRYGSVPFDYGEAMVDSMQERCGQEEKEEEGPVKSGTGVELSRTYVPKLDTRKQPTDCRDKEESESSEEEEWDRHEALYDDVTSQERTKERLYEEEMEVTWEKGGAGLVWYTDAQYWDQKEGDFDERTADDWDVDMSVYFDQPPGGDKDAKDYADMRLQHRRRKGLEKTDMYTCGFTKRRRRKEDLLERTVGKKIGQFEKYTRGVGRRLMEQQGWKDGEGLGKSVRGTTEAVEAEGQSSHEKVGFGYHGEKLSRKPVRTDRGEREVVISTVYDRPEDADPVEPLLRRNPPTTMKYRDKVTFVHESSPS